MSRLSMRTLIGLVVAVALAWGAGPDVRAGATKGATKATAKAGTKAPPKAATNSAAKATAKSATNATKVATKAAASGPPPQTTTPTSGSPATAKSRTVTVTDILGRKHTRVLPVTSAERQAAAARLKAKRDAAAAAARQKLDEAAATTAYDAAVEEGDAVATLAATQALAVAAINPNGDYLLVGPNGQLIPDYSGVTPNYANSPAPAIQLDTITGFPVINPATGLPVATGGGIRKFVDGLPGVSAAGANNLGQYIPVAVPDTTTYPGAEYYEIELGEYSEKLHSDLPPTRLRGYRQTNTSDASVRAFHYLGPLIIAKKGVPVRIKFTNNLPTGAAGNLFLPVDTSIMGAGPGPLASSSTPDLTCMKATDGKVPAGCYTENRATTPPPRRRDAVDQRRDAAPVDYAGR